MLAQDLSNLWYRGADDRTSREIERGRRASEAVRLAKATQEHRSVPNHLNRQFDQDEPGKVFVKDIAYLSTRKGQNVYLSCVKDVATREIVAHHLSTNLHMVLVFQTTRKHEV
ncbi:MULTISPECIES: hypothetical protein [Exiguobacterium]|uniref:hypothetical protein n=1 Tax=Exiguobacterium profundum TaxID=307643 RepID=UPI0025BCB60D|nr:MULTISPECIES: hypothetical protein [Exiguobacterium]